MKCWNIYKLAHPNPTSQLNKPFKMDIMSALLVVISPHMMPINKRYLVFILRTFNLTNRSVIEK